MFQEVPISLMYVAIKEKELPGILSVQGTSLSRTVRLIQAGVSALAGLSGLRALDCPRPADRKNRFTVLSINFAYELGFWCYLARFEEEKELYIIISVVHAIYSIQIP